MLSLLFALARQPPVGFALVVCLAVLGRAFATEAPQVLDCSRVYLGDLTGDLRRAEAESERAASAAQEATAEAKSAETRATELEAAADKKEREARLALEAAEVAEAASDECAAADRDLVECARLRSDASAAETQAFIAEQDAQEAARDAERARRGASGAAERAAAADRNAEESRSEVEKLRATKQRMEACDAQDAEPAAAERAERSEVTVATGGATGLRAGTGASAGTAEDWNVLLASGDGAAVAGAIASCTSVRPQVLERTVRVVVYATMMAYLPDESAVSKLVGEPLFRAGEVARAVHPGDFDLRLLRSAQFKDELTLDEIKRRLSRLDRTVDADYELRREASQWWQRISLAALESPLRAGTAVLDVLGLLNEEQHPSARPMFLTFVETFVDELASYQAPKLDDLLDLEPEDVCPGLYGYLESHVVPEK